MLSPVQQATGVVATNLMQSVLDSAEQRRAEEEEKHRDRKEDPFLKAKMTAGDEARRAREKISTYLFESNQIDVNQLRTKLFAKLAQAIDLPWEEGVSGFRYAVAVTERLGEMGATADYDLERSLGLRELRITMRELIAAIKNPFGEQSRKLNAALEAQAGGSSLTTFETAKVLQRLEGIAAPKSLEELKLGPQYRDPTRAEDDETRAERAEDIRSMEAMEKLDDVRELQEVLEERLKTPATSTGGEAAATSDDELLLLQVMSAAAHNDSDAEIDIPVAEDTESQDKLSPLKNASEDSIVMPPDVSEDINTMEPAAILPVHLDEIGIYALLKQKQAA